MNYEITDTSIYDLADIGLWHCILFNIEQPNSTEGLAEIGQRVCKTKQQDVGEIWDYYRKETNN